MKIRVMHSGEAPSQHLYLGQRDFPPAPAPVNGIVLCDQSCGKTFVYDDGCPAGWVEIESAGIAALRCPTCAGGDYDPQS